MDTEVTFIERKVREVGAGVAELNPSLATNAAVIVGPQFTGLYSSFLSQTFRAVPSPKINSRDAPCSADLKAYDARACRGSYFLHGGLDSLTPFSIYLGSRTDGQEFRVHDMRGYHLEYTSADQTVHNFGAAACRTDGDSSSGIRLCIDKFDDGTKRGNTIIAST